MNVGREAKIGYVTRLRCTFVVSFGDGVLHLCRQKGSRRSSTHSCNEAVSPNLCKRGFTSGPGGLFRHYLVFGEFHQKRLVY